MPAHKADYQTTGTADLSFDDFEVSEDIVIVDPLLEEATASGLIIADVGDAQKVRWGTVMAVGPGRVHDHGIYISQKFAVGDVVMFGQFQTGGEPITIAGKKYLLFRSGDFVGRMKRPGQMVDLHAIASRPPWRAESPPTAEKAAA